MNGIGFEILVILILILANGVFALAEIALVSSRKHRLQKKADEGSRNAVIALKLANEPNELLSAVQIGITLVGTIAGAFGGATVAEELAAKLNAIPQIDPHGESIALAAVVFAITGLSIILGELVPKRLALTNPEMFASTMAPFMKMLTRFASPVVRVLGWSTDQVLKLLPIPSSEGTAITEEEIRVLIKQGTKAGTFAETKLEMVEGVFQLGDRRVIELMLPRSKIVWLDINSDLDAIRNAIISSPCSRFPVAAGDLDHILGFVHVKDLLGQCLTGQPVDLKPCVRQLPAMPEMMTALKALELFQNSGTHVALVVNEHGGTKGLIEFNDVIEAIVGELPAAGEKPEQQANQREDGSWLIDGGMPVFEFKELLGISRLPGEDVSAYTTLGGFILMQLGRIPLAGDRVEVAGWRYEVVDMDRNRIDKLLISKSLSPPDADNERDSD
jgi:putative hemolysin